MIAAFFDIDGTLVKCNTQFELAREFFRVRRLPARKIMRLLWWFFLYRMDLVKETIGIRRHFYTLVSSLGEKDLGVIVEGAYLTSIKSRVNQSMMDAIRQHKLRGHMVVIVTATVGNIARKICENLPIDFCYATELHIANGRYTGEWKGKILEGTSKADFVRELSKIRDIDLSKSYAYGDSLLDLPILRTVGHPCVVNGSSKLRAVALKNHWTVVG